MDRRAWQIKLQKFDPKILEEIKSFRVEDLDNTQLKQNWIEFAKRFSKMKLTPQIVQSMNYQCIMSATLGSLSRKTEAQRKKIQTQQIAIEALKHEQQKLTQIYNDNIQKANLVKQKLEKLKKQDQEQDYLFDQMDSQQPQP